MSAPFDPPGAPESPSSLAVSLSASVTGEETDPTVALALTVRNDGDETVTLRFRTGQRADFAAYPIAAGTDSPEGAGMEPIWRHGEGRLFTQAIGTETLSPGDAATYEGTWSDPPSGTYAVAGWLTVSARDEGESETDGGETDGRPPTATATIAVRE